MEKDRIELSMSFLEPGGNYVQNVNVQLFCYNELSQKKTGLNLYQSRHCTYNIQRT